MLRGPSGLGAASHLQEIRNEVPLQIRLAPLPNLPSLQHTRDTVDPEAGGRPPAQATRIHHVISNEISILVQSVMRLAEGDARAAAGDEAGIDGVEAGEEGGVPWRCAGGVADAGMVFGDVIDAVHPVVDVVLHFGLFVGGGCHC